MSRPPLAVAANPAAAAAMLAAARASSAQPNYVSPAVAQAAQASSAAPQFWLLKVPNFVMDEFQRAENRGGKVVASIEVGQQPAGADYPPMKMVLKSSPLVPGMPSAPSTGSATSTPTVIGVKGAPIPAEYRIEVRRQQHPMVAFSSGADGRSKLERSVQFTADVIPPDTPEYRRLLQERTVRSHFKSRTTKSVVLPSAADTSLVSEERRKRKEQVDRERRERDKRVTKDAQTVRRLIFDMFEKKKYLTFKELQDGTNQPASSLKDVLAEVARYNRSGAFRQTYELLPEYQTAVDASLTQAALQEKQAAADARLNAHASRPAANPFLPAFPAPSVAGAAASPAAPTPSGAPPGTRP